MEIIIGLIVLYFIYRLLKGSSKRSAKKNEITLRVEVSGPGYRSDYESHTRPTGDPAKWYGSGKSVNVRGNNIPGGLIYVGGNLPDSNGYENDACLINPKLKVLPAEPWEAGDEMSYWPQYVHIPPRCRGAYLKWLASGRSEPEANIGYIFLFFYGLERRMFVDGQKGEVSEKERLEIVNEVQRLLKVYSNNRSFRGYASNFLAMEWVLYRSDKPIPAYLDFNDRYCSEPFQVVLAQYVAVGKPIPANVALQWLTLHPEFRLRTPARRCVKEFRSLFFRRYAQKFGDGLLVKPNKTRLTLEYRAASPSIRRNLKIVPNLPNPFILSGPIKKLGAIAEECTDELESYSRYLGRKDSDPKSLAALSLIPKELLIQTSGAKKVKESLAQFCRGGPSLISIDALYRNFGQKSPSQLNKKELENLASLLERMEFGIAPDIRFHNMKPGPEGNLAIFPKGHGIDFKPSKEFCTIGIIVRLGAMVSQIDRSLSPAEEVTIQNLIQNNRELNGIEKESLLAFLHWCIRTPQEAAGLKPRLAQVSTAHKIAISHILIAVAYADGAIDPKEIKQLEKLYATLGLDKEQVTSDIHALVAISEPVTVSSRDPETIYSIPQPVAAAGGTSKFILNEALLRTIEKETDQVKGVLADIFSDHEKDEADVDTIPAVTAAAVNPLSSLDKAHQNFFHRLLTQEKWERSALLETCKELGLMIDGAMEILNEWAFDNANAPLIEDGEPVYVDVNLAKEIINV